MAQIEDMSEAESVAGTSGSVRDDRFCAILGERQWLSLPAAVRRRFSKSLRGGASVIYSGDVRAIRYSRLGWLFANLLRLVGAPLPLSRKAGMVSVVAVTEDAEHNGQFWTRVFARERGFPQIIKSSKRFCGPTGLEEAIGFGIVIGLFASAEAGALVFRSQRYYLEVGGLKFPIPRALTPGTLTVSHTELTVATFVFSLHLEHALFGELVHQDVVYREDGA